MTSPAGYTPKPPPYSLTAEAQGWADTQPLEKWADIVLDPALEAELVAEAVRKATEYAILAAKEKYFKYENARRADKLKHLLRNPPPLTAGEVWRRVLAQATDMDPLLANSAHGFVLDDQGRPLFTLLCQYFARDIAFETSDPSGERSLAKGILLAGNIGAGKTTLLRIFREANPGARMRYDVAGCKELVTAYTNAKPNQGGPDALGPYAHKPYLLDDMGREPEVSLHYGNPVNVFEEILEQRYTAGHPFWQVHITSNLTPAGLDKRYGKRVFTRMAEMFNILSYEPTAIDRRTGLTPTQYDDQIKNA